MNTFVLDVPKELIAGRLTDGAGKYCAIGFLIHEILGSGEGWHLKRNLLSLKRLKLLLGVNYIWFFYRHSINDAEPYPAKRPALFKIALRELERKGHIEFLFLDELTKAEIQTRTDAQRCEVVDAVVG